MGRTAISNRVYDALKFCALILLPALGTLYFALAKIWGLPSAEEVLGTITAVDTFLGGVLKLSSNAYEASYDGEVAVSETDDKRSITMRLDPDPYTIEKLGEVKLKVVTKPPAPNEVG